MIIIAYRLGMAICRKLKDTKDLSLFTDAIGDSKMSVTAWSTIGKKLGVFDSKKG